MPTRFKPTVPVRENIAHTAAVAHIRSLSPLHTATHTEREKERRSERDSASLASRTQLYSTNWIHTSSSFFFFKLSLFSISLAWMIPLKLQYVDKICWNFKIIMFFFLMNNMFLFLHDYLFQFEYFPRKNEFVIHILWIWKTAIWMWINELEILSCFSVA